eukprot:7350288-Pyramimonas_sp.AAC.1
MGLSAFGGKSVSGGKGYCAQRDGVNHPGDECFHRGKAGCGKGKYGGRKGYGGAGDGRRNDGRR